MPTSRFTFHALPVSVTSSSAELIDHLRRDFSCFETPEGQGGGLEVEALLEPPDYSGLPDIPAAFVTPRNVVYRHGELSYLDYFGRGLAVRDRRTQRYAVYSPDLDMLREIVYLLILSRSGRHFDSQGVHRLHALALSFRGRGVLLLLPSGGGKSSTALELLGRPEIRLMSEDSPLIDRNGDILPFHTCLGIKFGSPRPDIPDRYLRHVRRMEFDPKTLVDLEFFQEHLETARTAPWQLIVGQRQLGSSSRLQPIPRLAAFKSLVTNMVVGIGLYQGLEFILERSTSEVLGKSTLVASRLFNALQLLRRVECHRFFMGRNIKQNCEVLETFLGERHRSSC